MLCWHLQESFPDARRLIEAGEMIPDTLVGDLLLEALLLDEPGLQDDLGFVVDGFPRTATQVGRGVCWAAHPSCMHACAAAAGGGAGENQEHEQWFYLAPEF